MKRWLFLLVALLVLLTACGDAQPAQPTTTTTTAPPIETDIRIEDIDWKRTTHKDGKNTYLAVTYTNHSEYTFSSFKMKFAEKADITKEQRDAYWSALEKSLGDDAKTTLQDMRSMLEIYDDQGLQVYVKDTKKSKPGATATVHCLLNNQLESKNVAFPELYDPYTMDIEYKKGDETVIIHYNFQNKTYSLR